MAQRYSQQEGIDYAKTFAFVARLEVIHILLSYASQHDIKLFQIDVRSSFLNGFINEEVIVKQPPGFESDDQPEHVFKLKKTLCGLKQDRRACYERLRSFFMEMVFQKERLTQLTLNAMISYLRIKLKYIYAT